MWLKAYHAVGLAIINGAGDIRNPFWIQHRQAFKNRPSFMDLLFCSHICVQHTHNNTLGYGEKKQPLSNYERRIIRNAKLSNPELNEKTTTTAVDEALVDQFPYLNSETLNATIGNCLNLDKLA